MIGNNGRKEYVILLKILIGLYNLVFSCSLAVTFVQLVASFSNNFFSKEIFCFKASMTFNILLKVNMITLLNSKKSFLESVRHFKEGRSWLVISILKMIFIFMVYMDIYIERIKKTYNCTVYLMKHRVLVLVKKWTFF